MGKKSLVELVSSITGKGTTMTAKSLAGVKVKLQTKIRKLEGKDKLSAEEKTELKNMKRQLKDVENEMAEESTKAGRSMQQKARDRKSKPVSLKEDLPPLKSEMQKGGMLKKPTADQKGLKKLPTAVRNKMGYMKRGGMMKSGNNDMRKGGMFYK
jgi:hypothetical protein